MKTKLFFLLLLVSSYSFSQTWTQLGVSEFVNDVTQVALTHDSNNDAYIAYVDAIDGMLYVKKQDGANWVNVGGAVSPPFLPTMPTIAIDPSTGHPWVAYVDNTDGIDVSKFNGTNWVSEGTDIGGITPEVKLMLKITPTSQPVLATQYAYSSTQKKVNLYKKVTGVWVLQFDQEINTRSFDLVAHDKIAYGIYIYGGVSGHDIGLRISEYNTISSTWNMTSNETIDTYGLHLYSQGLAATDHGSKIMYDYFEHGGANPKLRLYNGPNVLDSSAAKKDPLSLEYSAHDDNYYGMFLNSSNVLLVQKYISEINTWTTTDVNIGVTGTASKAKMNCSPSGTKLHVAYIDSANKIAVKEYNPSPPPTVFVDASATGNDDGTSWSDAYTSLDNAIANAGLLSEIWVAQGTYKPSTGTGREATFLVNKVITVYGGFNGTESNLEDRDPLNNLTILSGDLNGDDNATLTEAEATRQDNSYHVITLKGAFSSGGVFDGFTITGGNANGPVDSSCSTPVVDQYIHTRSAAVYGNPDGNGKAISMMFKNCIIEKNTATGMAVYYSFSPCGVTGTTVDIDFENCIVRDNYSVDFSAFHYGGSNTYNNCLLYTSPSPRD